MRGSWSIAIAAGCFPRLHVCCMQGTAWRRACHGMWHVGGPAVDNVGGCAEQGELLSRQCVPGQTSPCIFEYIYLARPDSVLSDIPVYSFQLGLGTRLAARIRRAPARTLPTRIQYGAKRQSSTSSIRLYLHTLIFWNAPSLSCLGRGLMCWCCKVAVHLSSMTQPWRYRIMPRATLDIAFAQTSHP